MSAINGSVTTTRAYLPPIVAALLGSIISGILSGSAAIFILNQQTQSTELRERREFDNRLTIVEATVRDYSSTRAEMLALSGKLERASTQLEDLRAEIQAFREEGIRK